MQFKHDKTGTYKERPPSKTNEMIQQLLDQQGQLLNQQQALYELLAEHSDKPVLVDVPIGVFSGGNDNGNQGNGNQGNGNQGNGNQENNNQGNNNQGNGAGNVDQGEDVQEYHCDGCENPIFPGQEHCPSCKSRLDWKNAVVN